MANVQLSEIEYEQLLDEVCRQVNPKTFPAVDTLFGYPIYPKDENYIIFVACEYCGISQGLDHYGCCAKCGAPLSGTRKIQRKADRTILSAIREALRGAINARR